MVDDDDDNISIED